MLSHPIDQLPVFMQDPSTYEILRVTAACIPKGGKAFLVGGAARNAMWYRVTAKRMPQRDYDILFMGDRDAFVANLRKRKFVYGKIRRKREVVLKKKKFPGAKEITDYVVLDIETPEEKDILQNLKKHANFTINGFAIPLRSLASADWHKKIIKLPGALRDLKLKQLRVNSFDAHPANLYACLRFMHQGFKPPSPPEVRRLLENLKKIEKRRFEKNVRKVFRYVEGEKNARKLVRALGIKGDIFDLKALRVIE